jgi:hypothetical protein
LASKVKDGILQLGDMKMDSIIKEDLILEFEYEVQKGETFESIAKKQNISKENLMLWNGFTYEQALKPGSKLKIKRVDE